VPTEVLGQIAATAEETDPKRGFGYDHGMGQYSQGRVGAQLPVFYGLFR
jgi:hypothetical protein